MLKSIILGVGIWLFAVACDHPQRGTERVKRIVELPEPDKEERLAYEANYPPINDIQKTAYCELTALCVHDEKERAEINRFIETLRDYDGDAYYLTTLNYFMDYMDIKKFTFIMRMDWKLEVAELEWLLETRLKKHYNLSLNLPNPASYGQDASVSATGVFEDFNRVLGEKGLQLGFIDTQSDEYIALLHRVKDRKRVEKAVKNIGYAYYE